MSHMAIIIFYLLRYIDKISFYLYCCILVESTKEMFLKERSSMCLRLAVGDLTFISQVLPTYIFFKREDKVEGGVTLKV